MSSPEGPACLQACPNCAALVDISDQEPLSKFHCSICGTAMRAARQFNHFSIVEVLGAGGMGSVYKALDKNLNRMVALKLLKKEMSADENYINKLEDEARITASISHPFVVKVFSFGSDFGQYYIAMELVDKGSLDDLMQLQGRVAELQVMQVGLQVASGLQAAHERGLIHRDVKPGNILFADAHTAKITDFGLALLAEQEAESRGEIWGTPYYIAPEKLNNQPEDFRSDIYSLGGTLFHAVAGRPPFEAESASMVALKHLKSRAVSLQAFAPDVSSETAYVINRMLHKDPNQRYASYGELLDHLKYAIETLQSKTGKPRQQKARVVVESAQQSHIAGILTLVMLVLVLGGGALAFVFRARLFGNPDAAANSTAQVASSAATATDAAQSATAIYDEARHQLIEGQYAAAQDSLATLLKTPNLDQPLQKWVLLHLGMAAMLNHQDNDARDAFGKLATGGASSNDEKVAKLANFFVQTGRFLSSQNAIPASVIRDWNRNSFESISLLLFGLKDWEQGSFDDAGKLLEEYLKGKPAVPYQWMAEYQPMAQKREHDYKLYAPLHDRMAAVADDKRAALAAEFTKAGSQLQTTGKIVDAFSAAEAELSGPAPVKAAAATPAPSAAPVISATPATASTPSVTVNAPTAAAAAIGQSTTSAASVVATPPEPATSSAATTAVAPPDPAARADEAARWQTTRTNFERLVAVYRFDAAASLVGHVQLTDPELSKAREQSVARAQQLRAFQRLLISDLNARGGFPQPVTSRRGVAFPKGIVSATADALQAATPYGTIATPWTDFTPDTFLAISRYFSDATTDPRLAGERQWAAAAFALETGRAQQARALATIAVRNVPAYQKDMPDFTGGAAH